MSTLHGAVLSSLLVQLRGLVGLGYTNSLDDRLIAGVNTAADAI